MVITWLIVLKVKWSVDKSKVREEAFCGNFHTALEEVVVWIFWIIVNTFFDFENADWENWSFTFTKTIHSCFKQVFADETTSWSNISTEVNRSEWHLSTSTRVHSVEVMNEAFHSLESLLFSIFV